MINVDTQSPDSIQNYLNQSKRYSGGSVVMQPGTYTLTSDISIPSGVILEGTSRDNCIIDCAGFYSVKIEGDNIYDTGTVTIANGDTTLVGTGTTFTEEMVGQSVFLDGTWYEIEEFTDATHLEIEEYAGDDLTAEVYAIATPNYNGIVRNLTIINAPDAGISARYCMEANIYDVIVYDCGTGIDLAYAVFPRINVSAFSCDVNMSMDHVEGFFVDFCAFTDSISGAGVVMTDTHNATFFNSSVINNFGNGLSLTNCSRIAFVSYDFSGNGDNGIEFIAGCSDNQITDGPISHNGESGIKITETGDRISISQATLAENGDYGINIANANCDSNVLVAVIASGNTTGSINDLGTGTLKDPSVNILP